MKSKTLERRATHAINPRIPRQRPSAKAPWGKDYAWLQLLTISDLLAGKTVDVPRENVTFAKAPKARGPVEKPGSLF